jgi:hypothetical protein
VQSAKTVGENAVFCMDLITSRFIKKHINALCRQFANVLRVKIGATFSKHSDLRDQAINAGIVLNL